MRIVPEPAGHYCLAPRAESNRLPRRDITAIVLIWVVLALVIDPSGDFPLNDDWAYGLSVKALVERGEIRFTDWGCQTLIAQTF